MVRHTGGCHCGRVRFEVTAPASIEVLECNCSICSKTAYLHLIVPRERFTLLNTHMAKHWFCSVCGVKSFYVPRSHPDGVSVNVRCLDPGTVEGITITQINGREWEQQYPEGRGEFS
jgi:hypothetical protein